VSADITMKPGFNEAASQPRRFMPLKTLANVLTALLASSVALTAARLVLVAPELAKHDPPYLIQADQGPFAVLSSISVFITVIAFLVWFRRAKINAEHGDSEQRYGRGWAIWGWIVPVLNFWIPFQIMDDLLRASRPRWSRSTKTWLPLSWWTSWLLFAASYAVRQHSGSLVALRIGYYSQTGHGPHGPKLPPSWPSFCLFAVAGLTSIVLVHAISWGKLGAPGTPAAEPAPDSPELIS
jgi:hypothetical protein